jgi:hypothetical protein
MVFPDPDDPRPQPAPTCACLRKYTRRSASTPRTCLGVFLDFFLCCLCWVPVFGELFDEVVRLPTHALTGAERGWRKAADRDYGGEKNDDDDEFYPFKLPPATSPAPADDSPYTTVTCNLLCCCSLKDLYRGLVKWVFYPTFRYLLLNVLFEVLAEDEGQGLRHMQEVYTFIGLVEALLLSMIISPVSNFGTFMATPGELSTLQQAAAYTAVYAIALAMGIAFLNLIIIIVLFSYLSGVHSDHLEEEIKALPVFGVPAVALVCSVLCFLLWFLCFTFVTVNWVMPTIVLAVCVGATMVFLPVLVYLFVFRLPHLSRRENARRKKALQIPVSIPYNVYERVVEELREEKKEQRTVVGKPVDHEERLRAAYKDLLFKEMKGVIPNHEERIRAAYKLMLFQPDVIPPERRAAIERAERTTLLPVDPDHGDLAPLFHQEFSEREKLCEWRSCCSRGVCVCDLGQQTPPPFLSHPFLSPLPPAQTGGW